MPECSTCSAKFTYKKNLYQHMRKQHSIEPQVPGKIICPLNCVETHRTYADLRKHLETFHQKILEKEVQQFPDYETFEAWKKEVESTSGYSYICRISKKLNKEEHFRTHYICHRSGVFKSVSKGCRGSRKTESNKIGCTCPASMEVLRSKKDGSVKVTYHKIHFGHDVDFERATKRSNFRPRSLAPIDKDVCVVLPAAGSGERMGVTIPKQYIPIHKKPLICYTVEAFLKIPFVRKVIVVAASESLDQMIQTLSHMCNIQDEKLMVTEGSAARHQSIKSGLKVLQTYCDKTPDIVVIHDGVRPFLTEEIVQNVVLAAAEHGAAGVVCPLVSTVINIDKNGFLINSLDRSQYKASEMPQAFKYDLISSAYQMCSEEDMVNGTECLHLVQKYQGINPKLLPGTTNLWKVTHRKDIYTAAAVVKENQTASIITIKPLPDFIPHLKVSLTKRFKGVALGRFNEIPFHSVPNLVLVQLQKNPYSVMEQMQVMCSELRLTQLTTIVNILYHEIEPSINFLELQKEAKASAKKLKTLNVLVYYVLWEKPDRKEDYEDKAELVSSLLFDSNPNISGTVFF